MYRVGYPGWRIAARVGLPLKLRVEVIFDEDAKVFVASSEDLKGLVVEATTIEQLRNEIENCTSELMTEACFPRQTHGRAPIPEMILRPTAA
jgi:Domain of unknown function (DUF1902)